MWTAEPTGSIIHTLTNLLCIQMDPFARSLGRAYPHEVAKEWDGAGNEDGEADVD